MHVNTYSDAASFLLKTRAALEKHEAANNLMLGLSLNLQRYPERIKTPPYFATVEDESGLVLAALMTPPHRLILYPAQDDYGHALELLAQNLMENGWSVSGALGPDQLAAAFAQKWATVSARSYREGLHERIYALTQVIWPPSTPGQLRLATLDDLELVSEWLYLFQQEAFGEANREMASEAAKNKLKDGDFYLWELDDKQLVSIAAKNRATANGICIGPVYTPPVYRGKGYASVCVAQLSQSLLDNGKRFCCLFTDLANPTSNSIYQKIGYQPVCDFNEYVFGE